VSGGDQGRYTSRLQSVARTAGQLLLLKPLVWRLLTVHVHGEEKLASLEGAYVVVGNHSSHFDAPLIIGSLPRRLSQYLATGAAGDYFFDKWWKAAPTSFFFNAFPIDRGSKARKGMEVEQSGRGRRGMARSLLADGIPLLLFPEGTRSRTGAMGKFNPGTASLCISRNVPCVPVALVGAHAAWPHAQSSPPRNRPPVHVVFGNPMVPASGEIAHHFNERIRRQVIELHDTTATAYGMKTLAEYARTVAIEKARSDDSSKPPDTRDPKETA